MAEPKKQIKRKLIVDPHIGCVNPECEYYNKAGSVVNLGVIKQSGKHNQYKCRKCHKQFSETFGTLFANKKTSAKQITQVLKALAEGNTIRGSSRIFKFSKDTIISWLKEAGQHSDSVEKLLVKKFDFNQVQLDELWSFILKKTTHAVARKKPSPTSQN